MPSQNWEATRTLSLYVQDVQNKLSNRMESRAFPLRDEEVSPLVDSAQEQFSFVIAYDDLPAARRGIRVIADMACRGADDTMWRPLPWRFDFLEHPVCRELALADAINADLILISTESRKELPPAVETWIKTSLERKRGNHAAVVALLGPSEHLDEPGSARLQLVRQAAQVAGLDFFAPFSNYENPLNPDMEISVSRREVEDEAQPGVVPCHSQNGKGVRA